MHPRRLSPKALLSSCLLTGLLGTAAGGAFGEDPQPRDELALLDLAAAFHGAPALEDYELMRSLWTEDAVFMGGGNVIVGATAIADFFHQGPGWGTTASLAPNYKTIVDIQGDTAVVRFECVIVSMPGNPLTTPLSSLPPGSQNPTVEIVQHSTATITAQKRRGEWRIRTFVGTGGPITP